MKKVFLLSGLGWGEQRELVQSLEKELGWEVFVHTLGSESQPELVPESLRNADLVIMRGAWTPSFEEAAFSELLATKLKFLFDELKIRLARGDVFKLLAIGRGANCLLRANWTELENLRQAKWQSYQADVGTWDTCQFLGLDGDFVTQVHARSFPKLEIPLAPDNAASIQTWAKFKDGTPVSWRWGAKVFLSWVDPLSYKDPSQLVDYGYLDSSKVPSRDDFLKNFESTKFSS